MADLVELLHTIQGTAEAAEDAGLADRGVALREIEELATEAFAALTASPAGDDPKALDAEAYKVGDFVRVISRDDDQTPHEFAIGSVHQIVEIYEDGSGVDLGDRSCRFHEIEPVARSSSTEAVEQEVERLRYILFLFREFWFQNVTQTKIGSGHHHPMWQAVAEALGPMNRDGTTPEEWQFITGRDKPFPSRPSPVPAACKPEGETHG